MVALVRIENETQEQYRVRLKETEAAIKQRLKGFWFHISKSFKRVPTLDKVTKEPLVDEITGKAIKHVVVDSCQTYTNPKRVAIKAERAARAHRNHFEKPAQVHNHG